MRSLDVSISIVSHNTKDDLRACLLSIYKYTKKISFEVLVIDNGSNDGTYQMVKSEFPQVIISRNKNNEYFTKPNNKNFKLARGEYFLILNADTYFLDNSIKKMADYLKKHEDVGAVEGLEVYEDGRLVPNGSLFSTPFIDFYELSFIGKKLKNDSLIKKFRYANKKRDNTFEVDVGCDAFLMVRTSVFKEIGGYDELFYLYYTENDICLKIKKRGYKIIHLGSSKVTHKVSITANKLKWKKLDMYYHDLKVYYQKNGYYIAGTVLYLLLTVEKYLLRIFRPNMFE